MFPPELIPHLKESAKILHPLPPNEELPEEIDTLPQARYFTSQIPNGLFVRMQLLIDLLDH